MPRERLQQGIGVELCGAEAACSSFSSEDQRSNERLPRSAAWELWWMAWMVGRVKKMESSSTAVPPLFRRSFHLLVFWAIRGGAIKPSQVAEQYGCLWDGWSREKLRGCECACTCVLAHGHGVSMYLL